MTYGKAEKYLFSFLNISRRDFINPEKNCQINLDGFNFFLNILGNPQNKIPHYIHVTGTSGKGSVVNFLHSILYTAGKNVGSAQSPHPTHIRERWKIKNQIMAKNEFIKIIKKISIGLQEYIRTSPYDMISYFEILCAIGFLFFAEHKVAWAIIEVGMGGRCDASNVINKKDIAIITNVGLDHQNLIGPTKKDILYEKAGIIKNKCKVFTKITDKKMLTIIKNEVNKTSSSLNILNTKFNILKSDITGSKFIYNKEQYIISAPGVHQINNATIAIEVAKTLKIPNNIIQKGLKNTVQILRLEPTRNNNIILDGAHNVDKIESTVKFIARHYTTNKSVHLLIGFSEDKQWKKMLKKLITLNPKSISITRNTANIFRKTVNPADIKKTLISIYSNKNIQLFLDPLNALSWSMNKMKKNDILLITGSIFLSGELRPALTKPAK